MPRRVSCIYRRQSLIKVCACPHSAKRFAPGWPPLDILPGLSAITDFFSGFWQFGRADEKAPECRRDGRSIVARGGSPELKLQQQSPDPVGAHCNL